jgi:MFS family permease
MGHFNMAFFGGLALGPWMGGLLKDIAGIDSAFYSMGALSLFGFVLSLFTLPKTPFQARNDLKPQASYLQIMRIPSLLAMFLFRLGSIIGVGMNWTFMPLYGHEVLHLSGTKIGILVSLTVIMTTILQPYFGRLCDRTNRPWMAFWGGAVASLCLIGVPYCHSFWQLFVLNLALGSAIGLYMPPLMAMAVAVGRRIGQMTKVMSLLEMAFSFGMVIGPLAAGLIKESLGLGAIFLVGGIVGIGASLVFMLLIPRAGHGENESVCAP